MNKGTPVEDIPIFLLNLDYMKGKEIKPGITLIEPPRLDLKTGRWTALANVCGALAIVEVKLRRT